MTATTDEGATTPTVYEQDDSRRLGRPALELLLRHRDAEPLLCRRQTASTQPPEYKELPARIMRFTHGAFTGDPDARLHRIHYHVQTPSGDWESAAQLITEDGHLLNSAGEPIGYFVTAVPFSG